MRYRQHCENALSVSVREGEIKGMGLSILRNLLIIMTMFLSQNKKHELYFIAVRVCSCLHCNLPDNSI